MHVSAPWSVNFFVMVAVYRFVASALIAVLLFVTALPLEARTRKGDKLVKEGNKAEDQRDYDKALSLYEEALATDYGETGYQLVVRRVRFAAGQMHVDTGRKLRAEGKLKEALAEFQKAFAIDPSSSIAQQEARRIYQILQRDQEPEAKKEDKGLSPSEIARRDVDDRIAQLASVPELKPVSRQITNLKMNNQPARVLFETVSKLAGINVLFDPDFIQQLGSRTFTLDLTNSTIDEALDYLSLLTRAYWKPISANAIFVTRDEQTKRRDYEDVVAKVFYLQNVTAVPELNEIAAALRTITEIRRLLTYSAQMAIMVRGTSDAVALAQKLINDLDKPKAEVVIDVTVMEANRTKTRNLVASIANGTTPGLNVPVIFTPNGQVPSNGDGDGGDTPSTPQGFIPLRQLGRISNNDFSVTLPGAIVQALLNDRSTRVLQNPQIRVLDSQKAEIKIGDRYPYATGSFQAGVTTSVSPLVSTQFQFADVGVNVSVTPKIHSNDEVTMHLEIDVSNIRDRIDVGGLSQPVIGQRKVTEDIRLKEGEVSLIGGLTGISNTRGAQGFPGLATLPGIGWLFGNQSTDYSKNELLIILTPRIVRAPDITEVNLRAVAAGNEQTVRLSYLPRKDSAQPAAAPAPPGAQPATPPPAPAEPKKPATPTDTPAPSDAPRLALEPSSPSIQVDGTITISVDASNMNDLFAAPFRVNYPKELLRLVDVVRGPMMASGSQPVSFTRDVNTGVVRVTRLPGASGVSGAGQLVTLRFQALAKGSATVSLQDLLLQDSKLQPVNVPAPSVAVKIE